MICRVVLSRVVLSLGLWLWPVSGQIPDRPDYSAYHETGSGTSAAFTVQAGSRSALITDFGVECVHLADPSATCTVTIEKGGAAASSTQISPVRLNDKVRSPVTSAFHTSNAGAGTVVVKTTQMVNSPTRYLSGFVLSGSGSQVTIRVESSTAMTFRFWSGWKEQ